MEKTQFLITDMRNMHVHASTRFVWLGDANGSNTYN